MNFDFSDEQKQLRDEARKFLAEKCPPKTVRRVLDGKEPYDRELWKGLGDMGFLGVAIPEAYGGAGAGHLELCVIAEEMGRALAPVPFSSTVYLAAEALLLAGSDAQRRKWLPLVASGEAIGTLALFEGKGNPSPEGIKLSAAGVRAGRRRRPRAGNGPRLCAGSHRLRPSDRLVPGGKTYARRHVCLGDAGALELLLRRLGALDQRIGIAGGCGCGAHQRDAGIPALRQEQHPGSWRHGFYMGIRLPLVLSAFQRDGAGARQSLLLGRRADRPHAQTKCGVES